jgi:hypothetical protein
MLVFLESQRNTSRPIIIFFDGWDSHFHNVLEKLRLDRIYTFFLRSQNSVVDQPNDNGPNAMVHGAFSQQFSVERAMRPTVNLLTASTNRCIAAGLAKLQTEEGARCIRNAFQKTGLYPLNRNTPRHQEAARLALPYTTPTATVSASNALLQLSMVPPVSASASSQPLMQTPAATVSAPSALLQLSMVPPVSASASSQPLMQTPAATVSAPSALLQLSMVPPVSASASSQPLMQTPAATVSASNALLQLSMVPPVSASASSQPLMQTPAATVSAPNALLQLSMVPPVSASASSQPLMQTPAATVSAPNALLQPVLLPSIPAGGMLISRYAPPPPVPTSRLPVKPPIQNCDDLLSE